MYSEADKARRVVCVRRSKNMLSEQVALRALGAAVTRRRARASAHHVAQRASIRAADRLRNCRLFKSRTPCAIRYRPALYSVSLSECVSRSCLPVFSSIRFLFIFSVSHFHLSVFRFVQTFDLCSPKPTDGTRE